jgi:histidyl-tRNA synthetase
VGALQPVRGTHDLLPDEARRHRHVESQAFDIAQRYGFDEIITPVFEFTEVFARTLGETSDVVSKEMYSFTDRGGEQLTLRPEGTAGVARAVISCGLTQSLPLKLFYRGPMFRYERPQKGRQRQFNQIGAEILGVAGPEADIEVIALGAHILDQLGLSAQVHLEINSLGDGDSRAVYRQALVDYLGGRAAALSDDSRQRLHRNPLRVLDSKDEGDRAIVAAAPLLIDYLNDASRDFFRRVEQGLAALGVRTQVNPRLVRGLDYYSHTAFEFVTTALGAQGTVMAGGRYDGLISQMGGPSIPGIGWAAGVERLAMLATAAPDRRRPLAVIPLQDDLTALQVTQRLRQAGFTVELGYAGNAKKRLNRANKLNARAAVFLGAEELTRQAAIVRDLDSGEQEEVPLSELEVRLARFR